MKTGMNNYQSTHICHSPEDPQASFETDPLMRKFSSWLSLLPYTHRLFKRKIINFMKLSNSANLENEAIGVNYSNERNSRLVSENHVNNELARDYFLIV